MNTNDLENKIGYHFKNKSLLTLALTHSSYINEHGLTYEECNERIEFLGDAVLELASSDFLYKAYADDTEGDLSKIRASLVCEKSLADVAREIELGKYILLGKGEDSSGGRLRDSILSDAFESVIGAIYLDSGFTNAKEFVDAFVMKDIEKRKLFYDSKTILQELVQAKSLGEIDYNLIKTEGPDHDKIFTSEVLIGGTSYGVGSGHSKKLSEQRAAYEAINKLKGGID